MHKGIPNYFRGYVWKSVMPQKERKEFPKLYTEFVKYSGKNSKHDDLILKDVDRIMPIQLHQKIDRISWYFLIVICFIK